MTDEDLTELLNRCFDLIVSRGQAFSSSEGAGRYCDVADLVIERWNIGYDELSLQIIDDDAVHVFSVEIDLGSDGRPDWSKALIRTKWKWDRVERALASLRRHFVLDDLASL